jgi:hypothetical protein
MGFAPKMTHGGCTLELPGVQSEFGTAVKLELSGEVSNWMVAERLPVEEYVTPKMTQGVPVELLRFDWLVKAPDVVNVKTAVQLACGA